MLYCYYNIRKTRKIYYIKYQNGKNILLIEENCLLITKFLLENNGLKKDSNTAYVCRPNLQNI